MITKLQEIIGVFSGVTVPKLVNHKRIHTPEDVIGDVIEFNGDRDVLLARMSC